VLPANPIARSRYDCFLPSDRHHYLFHRNISKEAYCPTLNQPPTLLILRIATNYARHRPILFGVALGAAFRRRPIGTVGCSFRLRAMHANNTCLTAWVNSINVKLSHASATHVALGAPPIRTRMWGGLLSLPLQIPMTSDTGLGVTFTYLMKGQESELSASSSVWSVDMCPSVHSYSQLAMSL
jgi:hypothetical protein